LATEGVGSIWKLKVTEVSVTSTPSKTHSFPKLTEYLPGFRVVVVLRSSLERAVKCSPSGVFRITRPRNDRARVDPTLGIQCFLFLLGTSGAGDPYRETFLFA
jgi:hypothetical protein